MSGNVASNAPNPNSTAPRITSQTPRTRLVDAALKSIPKVRTKIGREMDKEVVVCSVPSFMKAYLPFVASKDTLKEVTDLLQQKGLLTGDLSQFTNYPPRSKSAWASLSEAKAFAPLEDIAKAIGEYRFPDNNPPRNNYHYRNCPTTTITSDIEGSTHKNDACFTSDGADQTTLSETGMAVPLEFKLNGLQRVQNNLQVVSASAQIMNEDLRRMFIFGISIEADMVTLWYHSRSHSAASKQFSFVKDPTILIQVFIAFMFGTSEQLGYDPNVTLEKDRHYTFTIPSKPDDTLNTKLRRFRSINTIVDYRSMNITGRMTRIILVEELGTGKEKPPQFVLKDVWLDKSAPTERELQNSIFSDIVNFWQGNSSLSNNRSLKAFKDLHADLVESREFKNYFLQIVADYSGKTSKALAQGSVPTRGLLDARHTAPARPPSPSKSRAKSTASSLPRGSANKVHIESTHKVDTVPVSPARTYQQKRQYRVIFKEYCTPVGELETLGEVVDVLHQVLTPLQLLFCAGWVHRDISAGNILAYGSSKTGWQVKLSDLEYAKRFPPSAGYVPAADPKTGTPFFMAHEILTHYQLYSKARINEAQLFNESDSETEITFEEESQTIPADSVDTARPLAIHNFQHDLESIWWLLLWTITSRVEHRISQDWGAERFHNSGEMSHQRSQCFLVDIEEQLTEVLKPAVQLAFATSMNFLRYKMRKALETRQTKGKVNNVASYAEIHAKFLTWFRQLRNREDTSWRGVPLGDGTIVSEPTPPANDSASEVLSTSTQTPPNHGSQDDIKAQRAEDGEHSPTSDTTGAAEASSQELPPASTPAQAQAQVPSPVQTQPRILSPARLPKRHFEENYRDDSDSESDTDVAKIQSNLVSKLFSISGPSGSKRQKHNDQDAPL